jgi:group II intron reverse transcriptase/maturase
MTLGGARHQKPAQAGRTEGGRGEAATGADRDEASPARHERTHWGCRDLLAQVLAKHNMALAWKRVKANKGSAGADGLTVPQTAEYLRTHWPAIRRNIEDGTYRPTPVRCVAIPKPGGGERELGIPTVIDRLIQQALLQVLQPIIDPTFSEHSHGFRPGRSAHGAIREAQGYVQQGYRVVVDVDLEKFFDRVNHDILMDRLSKRIADKAVLRLVRRYLEAGIMVNGVRQERYEGTPQGGPLSPLLANILLDDIDRELERRGHRFVRYADDCNLYVRSRKAGRRVLANLTGLYARLRLKVNEAKTAVGSVFVRKFLGYCFWVAPGGGIRLKVSKEAVQRYKRRIRQITRRTAGRSIAQVVQELKDYVPGWKLYFSPGRGSFTWNTLDEWLRRRLRAIHLKHWKRGTTAYRELRALGASEELARRVASNTRRWWRNSVLGLNRVLNLAYFDRLGVPRLC